MPGRVFVTGGSGFVGSHVIEELLARGYAVSALVHRRKPRDEVQRVTHIEADLYDRSALAAGMSGCDAVIHLIGIIMERPSRGTTFERVHVEGTRCVADAARAAGVQRYIHMSALGARPNAVSIYHRTKYQAEEYVRASPLAWTIFRPSLIHGPRGDFSKMEAAWARGKAPPFLFMPYFGGGALGGRGAGLLQPVYVRDVARAFVDAIENPKTIREIYPLGGPDRVTWPQLHRAFAEAVVGRKRATLALPAWYARLLTGIVPRALLPFNRDQVQMSQEDNTADLAKFVDDFGWTPRPFEASLHEYAATL